MARITFSGICQYLGSRTAVARRGLIKKFKYPQEGPMKSYVAAEQRIVAHLVDGTALDPEHDQVHVSNALHAFLECGWPEAGVQFLRPNIQQDKLHINGVEISLKPSLLLRDANGHRGACKLFFTKSPSPDRPQLAESVGRMMAALLYYYGAEHLADADYKSSLCQLVCIRDGDVHVASGRHKRLMENVEAACDEIRALWAIV